MAESESYAKKIIKELNTLRKSGTLNAEQERNISRLANYFSELALSKKLDDASVKKTLYATFKDPSLQGGIFRSTLSILPENSVINETLISEKPKYVPPKADSIAEAFKDEGGKEVIDERSPNYWAMNPNITRAKIRAVAKSQGMTEQELIKALEQETLKETRRQISLGEDVGSGWFDSPKAFTSRATARVLGLLAPRTMELVREGKDFDPQKLTEDALENYLYLANPAGRAIGFGLKGLGATAFGKALLENQLKKRALGIGKNAINAFATPAMVEGIESSEGKPYDPLNVLYGGTINLVGNRLLKNRAGRFSERKGDFNKLAKAFEGETEEKVAPTFKEFSANLEKDLKRRDKIAKGIGKQEAELAMSPKEISEFKKVTPVFSGDPELDKTATEIAKIVGRSGVSLDEATRRYFANMSKKKGSAYVGQYVERLNDRKNPVFVMSEGSISPNKNLKDLISQSSWGKVLETEFSKTPRKAKESFTKKYLLGDLEGVLPPDYTHWLQGKSGKIDNVREGAESILEVIPYVEEEQKDRKRKKAEEEEMKYRKGYIFNPYVEE